MLAGLDPVSIQLDVDLLIEFCVGSLQRQRSVFRLQSVELTIVDSSTSKQHPLSDHLIEDCVKQVTMWKKVFRRVKSA